MKVLKKFKFSKKQVSKTKFDKPVKARLTKKDYVQLMSDASKWPLPQRLAAELWRSGVTLERFEKEMHFEDNSLSKMVYECMVNFHLVKGYDPKIIPPIMPVYVRYKSPTDAKEEASYKGRPSAEQAIAFVKKLIKKKVEDGWKEEDLFKAFRVLDESDNENVYKIKGNLDEDLPDVREVIKTRVRKVPEYHILVGNDWLKAKGKEEAEKLHKEAELTKKVMPVKEPKTHCAHCKFPLNELVVTIRDKKGHAENMHLNCYWLNSARPESIPMGLSVLSPKEGVAHRWEGGNKGWITIHTAEPTPAPTLTPVAPMPEPVPEPDPRKGPNKPVSKVNISAAPLSVKEAKKNKIQVSK